MAKDNSFLDLLRRRKTIRKFKKGTLSREALDEILFAAFGKTHDFKNIAMRTAPSAGATYPLDIYVAVEDIEGVDDGIYKYDTASESPQLIKNGRYFKDIRRAALDQAFISASAINLLMVYTPERIVPEYGGDSFKYAAMECGHIGQNLLLMATALGLGAVPVGAFDSDKMAGVFGIKHPHEALYLISIGIIAQGKEGKA